MNLNNVRRAFASLASILMLKRAKACAPARGVHAASTRELFSPKHLQKLLLAALLVLLVIPAAFAQDAADNVERGYLEKCGGCRTARKLRLQTLSDDYREMFEKKIATYTYISSDKADTRTFFPGLGKDFDMSVCKSSIEQLKKSDDTVVCIGRTWIRGRACYQPTAWPSLRWSEAARYRPATGWSGACVGVAEGVGVNQIDWKPPMSSPLADFTLWPIAAS